MGLCLCVVSCIDKPSNEMDKNVVIEQKIDSLLAQMTLREKIGQMTQIRHFDTDSLDEIGTKFIGSVIQTQGPIPGQSAAEWQAYFTSLQKIALSTRLGIPLLIGVDAIHGQNTFNGATIFPHSIGMGATMDTALVREAAAITAIEMQATGFNWTFAPCIAVPYNEKWGRFYEAFSESSEVCSKLGVASIKGYQGILSDRTSVLATAKHYLGDGSTDFGVDGGNCSLDKQEINQRLIPPYLAAIHAGVGSIMVSFNSLLGLTMHANKELITDSLKKSFGFDGMVISDWKGYSRFGENEIINAGIDMVMAVDGDLDEFQSNLFQGVQSGYVSMERIDDAVRRILRQKFRLGLFKHPFPDTGLIKRIGCKAHRDLARKAVRESLVLLKNKDHVLPLGKKSDKIVVVGEHANNTGLQSGGWTINWQGSSKNYTGATTILKGIRDFSDDTVIYDPHATGKYIDADVAIIVVGETPYAEFMGDIGDDHGKYSLTLSKKHQEYINAYAGKGPKIVVILISGRPLVITGPIEKADAFVAAWLPGSEGKGIAEVLFGAYDFTGTLPHSWPKSIQDFSGKYGPNYWDSTATPLYKMGYGLTYGSK